MLKEFKDFAMRGNVLDMAVGIVIGAAFGKIITSFVSDILMPPIGLILGKADFSNLFIDLAGGSHASLAAAKAAGLELGPVSLQQLVVRLTTGRATDFEENTTDKELRA